MLYSTNTGVATDRSDVSLEEGILMLIDAGFPALDFTFRNGRCDYAYADNALDYARTLRNMANERGVIFNQAHAPFGGGYDKYTAYVVPNLPKVIRFAAELGAKNLVVHPLQRGRYYGNEDELYRMNLDFYRSLAPYAKDCGIRIGIENMWQRHPVTNVICDDACADPCEMNRLFDELDDTEAFTVCMDIGHVALCGREPERVVREVGHRIGMLHVHDVDYVNDLHTLPGLGKINFDAVSRSLAAIGYSGDFTLELKGFPGNLPLAHLPKAFRFMAETAELYANLIEAYKGEVK